MPSHTDETSEVTAENPIVPRKSAINRNFLMVWRELCHQAEAKRCQLTGRRQCWHRWDHLAGVALFWDYSQLAIGTVFSERHCFWTELAMREG